MVMIVPSAPTDRTTACPTVGDEEVASAIDDEADGHAERRGDRRATVADRRLPAGRLDAGAGDVAERAVAPRRSTR